MSEAERERGAEQEEHRDGHQAEASVATQIEQFFSGNAQDHGGSLVVHVLEVDAFEVGVSELAGGEGGAQFAVIRDPAGAVLALYQDAPAVR
jgi:hypothetical protein